MYHKGVCAQNTPRLPVCRLLPAAAGEKLKLSGWVFGVFWFGVGCCSWCLPSGCWRRRGVRFHVAATRKAAPPSTATTAAQQQQQKTRTEQTSEKDRQETEETPSQARTAAAAPTRHKGRASTAVQQYCYPLSTHRLYCCCMYEPWYFWAIVFMVMCVDCCKYDIVCTSTAVLRTNDARW